ncbi:hypothetical protein LJ655_29840 [Paraburkholderia sp. MMS20-SJTN17]|uniref:Uncharacterized protein n=1 Tax=Paraburkholderia translucens TaxID=2886945 RepID=A0ABS8KML9_9BURK|nr:hypothetical protein [Paraburkholderia sp. MMS20-SJTN17]MCC8406005.1 hypothetical protein [Paraburkholderia sp. MMS20-SJTN17]
MTSFPEIDYQKQLVVSGLDDFSPNAALSQVHGGQFGSMPELWRQAVVDFLRINVHVGLLEGTHRKEISGEAGAHLLENLLNFGDKANSLDAEILWNVLYFNASPKLAELLSNFHLDSWDALSQGVNGQFMESLKAMYSKI